MLRARSSSPLRVVVYIVPASEHSSEQSSMSKKAVQSTELGTSPCPVPRRAVNVCGLFVS